jgi:hypothetical protein
MAMARWQAEHELTKLLRAIGRADAAIDPPPGIEERMMERWEARFVKRVGPERNWRSSLRALHLTVSQHVVPAGLGFAAIVLIAFAVSGPPGANRAPSESAVPPVESSRSVPTTVAPRALPEAAGPADAEPIAAAARGPSVQTGKTSAAATGFYPIAPDAHQMLRSYTVARVSLPREVLGNLGLVPDVSRVGGPIEADVVFGEDGLARAIRLVPDARRSE